MKLSLRGTREYFSPHNMAKEKPADAKVDFHAYRETLENFIGDTGRVAIFIDA